MGFKLLPQTFRTRADGPRGRPIDRPATSKGPAAQKKKIEDSKNHLLMHIRVNVKKLSKGRDISIHRANRIRTKIIRMKSRIRRIIISNTRRNKPINMRNARNNSLLAYSSGNFDFPPLCREVVGRDDGAGGCQVTERPLDLYEKGVSVDDVFKVSESKVST